MSRLVPSPAHSFLLLLSSSFLLGVIRTASAHNVTASASNETFSTEIFLTLEFSNATAADRDFTPEELVYIDSTWAHFYNSVTNKSMALLDAIFQPLDEKPVGTHTHRRVRRTMQRVERKLRGLVLSTWSCDTATCDDESAHLADDGNMRRALRHRTDGRPVGDAAAVAAAPDARQRREGRHLALAEHDLFFEEFCNALPAFGLDLLKNVVSCSGHCEEPEPMSLSEWIMMQYDEDITNNKKSEMVEQGVSTVSSVTTVSSVMPSDPSSFLENHDAAAGTSTPQAPQLILRDNSCKDDRQCNMCEGGCEKDEECAGNLKCSNDGGQAVLGCKGTPAHEKRYCYDPLLSVANHETADGTSTPQAPQLILREDSCKDERQCNMCEGNCDYDDECAGNLKCSNNNRQAVLGCKGTPAYDRGYCYDPSSFFENHEVAAGTSTPQAPQLILRDKCKDENDERCNMCEGDCEKDDECEGNLKCFEDNGEAVPGCQGSRESGKSYCYDPYARRDRRLFRELTEPTHLFSATVAPPVHITRLYFKGIKDRSCRLDEGNPDLGGPLDVETHRSPNKYFSHVAVSSLQECQTLCLRRDDCTGVEHDYVRGMCNVWTSPIGHMMEAMGAKCFVKAKSRLPPTLEYGRRWDDDDDDVEWTVHERWQGGDQWTTSNEPRVINGRTIGKFGGILDDSQVFERTTQGDAMSIVMIDMFQITSP